MVPSVQRSPAATFRLRAVGLGGGAGWLACALLDRMGLVRFASPPPDGRILNLCVLSGYPKVQDYFWYVAYPALALAGAWIGGLLAPRPLASARSGGRAGPVDARSDILAALIALGVAAVWTADPWMNYREIDWVHEGVHLLHVQAWLAGDRPGLDVHTEYGPLYTWSIIWWMRTFGLHFTALRVYFETAQALGAALAIWSITLVAASRAARLAGAALVLFASVAALPEYGWANGMRFAPALAAVACGVRGLDGGGGWCAGAGVLVAIGVLYSPEFGAAGAVSLGALLAVSGRRRDAFVAGAGFFAAFAFLAAAMWGSQAPAALRGMLSGGYGLARLAGHGARALPTFSASGTEPISGALRPMWVIGLWLPALAAVAGCAWRLAGSPGGTRAGVRAVLPLALLSYLANVAAIVRPYHNLMMAVPAVAALLAVLAQAAPAFLPRAVRLAGALGLAGYCLLAPFGGAFGLHDRIAGPEGKELTVPGGGGRLGRLRLSPASDSFLRRFVPLIQRHCPPDRRVFAPAMSVQAVCFLADRATLPPFPEPAIALSAADRAAVLEALERVRPPLAMIGETSMDTIPYRLEHPEQWSYLRRWYYPKHVFPSFMLALRRKTPRPDGTLVVPPGTQGIPRILRDF